MKDDSSIKNIILQILKNDLGNFRKNLRKILKKQDLIKKEVYSKYFKNKNKDLIDQVSFSEFVFLCLQEEDFSPFCKHGNKKKFISFQKGYKKYCSPNCACKREDHSRNLKSRYALLSNEEKEKMLEKARESCMKKYGTFFPLQSENGKEKIKNTMLKKYGVDSAQKCNKIKNKTKETNLKKYGTEHPMKNKNIREKASLTLKERLGVEYPLQSQEIKKRLEENNLKKYGEKCTLLLEEVRNKSKNTSLIRYGVDHPMKNKEIADKVKETTLKKYGVSHVLKNEIIQEKIKRTNLQKWGVPYYFQTKEFQEKFVQSNREKYGKNYHTQKHIPDEIFKLLNDRDWLKKKYKDENKTITEIADEIGVHFNLVYRRLRFFGIETEIKIRSKDEKKLEDFIKNLGYRTKSSAKNLIRPFEIDIFIEEKNIAIEYCGLYWHCNRILKYRTKKEDPVFYHKRKLEKCLEKGIKLITIFSNEWVYDEENTKKRLEYIFSDKEEKLYESEIGQDKIFVDRRWTEGKFLLNKGYYLLETLEPKLWGIKKGHLLLEEDPEKSIDFISDCGWHVYQKKIDHTT